MNLPIPSKETLTVEFKSDRDRLKDDHLIEALVALANTQGGELWLGVEDDGTPSGLHAAHTDAHLLPGLVAARTSPSLAVSVEMVATAAGPVARISVPRAWTEVATTSGVYLRRRLKHDGTPESVPLLPHERQSRASAFGLQDVSAQAVAGGTLADLDPLERERLRQLVRQYGGDRALLDLDDDDLDGALGFTIRSPVGGRVPTLTGLLVIGKEFSLRELVPTHEVAFQVLAREEVRLNEFRRFPLLKALDWLETNFRPYNPEREVQIDLFRVPIPRVDQDAFREAVANALVHRDYHRLGAVHVRLDDDGLTVSNPGGLVEGVTLQNLLTTEPRPRNPALADALKRIGLVERSGRGVDKIYRGLLRFGRPEPDYSRTDATSVVLRMSTVDADEPFLRLVVDQEGRQNSAPLPIGSLIVLAALKDRRRLGADELAVHIQRDAVQVKKVLETLVEAGLISAYGTGQRTYTLSAEVYRAGGQEVEFTRQAGLSSLQHEQMVLAHVANHSRVQRAQVVELCHLSDDQASRLLARLTEEGKLVAHGENKGRYYTLGADIR